MFKEEQQDTQKFYAVEFPAYVFAKEVRLRSLGDTESTTEKIEKSENYCCG
jgi:hypothetical protein